MTDRGSITILVVDDHPMMRDGVTSALSREPDLRVVGQAADGTDAVAKAKSLRPHVVIMDVTMPGLTGVDATSRIVAADPAVRVVGLSVHADPGYVEAMLAAGAAGYLLKGAAPEEVVRAVRTVAAGHVYLAPEVTAAVVRSAARTTAGSGGTIPLSPREKEVLRLLAEGKATKRVALDLGISAKTVESHRRQIMEKLNLWSLPELTKYAIRQGLTSIQP